MIYREIFPNVSHFPVNLRGAYALWDFIVCLSPKNQNNAAMLQSSFMLSVLVVGITGQHNDMNKLCHIPQKSNPHET